MKVKSAVAAASQVAFYSVHPSVAMMQAWAESLPDKTGRTLEEWVELARDRGPDGELECRAWLKKTHSLGANTAWWIAERAVGKASSDHDPDLYLEAAEGYVTSMFAEKKAGLKPIFDEILRLVRGFGADVKVCPCQTIVPLYRQHVFAQIKPATATRIDLGLALKGVEEPLHPRLIDTGGLAKRDRITHRFSISSLSEIDGEVRRWLRIAYDLDG